MNKKALSERDICTKFINPALVAAGWDVQSQVHEEVYFTKGRVIVRGKMTVLDALEATRTTARTTSERLLAATIARLNAA